MPDASRLSALLGPTNTGKTHRALLRMLEHESGMIGLPLRLLAREVYDRAVARVGEERVALVTGEERRVPRRPDYWVCTVEAMPLSREVDFVAVDEVQLAEHEQRGHVFTDRILHARGRLETMFLGSATMRPIMAELVPTAKLTAHPRLSRLAFSGASTLGRLPPRSVVVGFSLREVYEVAERLRASRGGAAVVLGALSPRTRNAQVALFQSGEVDYLVATDAIGMGLNLDVAHVAFASLRKFDGRDARPLSPQEVGQIAGRAGRWIQDGTFGTVEPTILSPGVAEAVEAHAFQPVRRVRWRNDELDYSSIAALLATLRRPPRRSVFVHAGAAEDAEALARLGELPEIRALSQTETDVQLLWEVCSIPDFRRLMFESHLYFLRELFVELRTRGRLSDEWMAPRVEQLDDVDGDADTLIGRVSAIRTFTYVAQRAGWLASPELWEARTRAVEDRLSDALHDTLVRRFVDETGHRRRRPARTKNAPVAMAVSEEPVDPHHPFAGLAAFRQQEPEPSGVAPLHAFDRLADAPKVELVLEPTGRIFWEGQRVGELVSGTSVSRPEVKLAELGSLPGTLRPRLRARLSAYAREVARDVVAPLSGLDAAARPPEVRGLAYALGEGLGTIRAASVAPVSGHDGLLNARGIVRGARYAYLKASLRPDALVRRAVLVHAFLGRRAESFDPTATTLPRPDGLTDALVLALGFVPAGPRMVRVDVAERVLALAGGGETRWAKWLARPEPEASEIARRLVAGEVVEDPLPP